MSFSQNTWKILGGRGSFLLLFGVLGGLVLSSVDLGFTLLLHSLFFALGIQEPQGSEAAVIESLSAPMLAAALLGVGITRYAGLYLVNIAAASAHRVASTRLRLIRFHISLKKNAFTPLDPSETQHAFHEIYPKTAMFFRHVALFSGNSLYALGLVAVMVYHEPWLSLASVLSLLLIAPIIMRSRKSIRESALRIPAAHKELMRGIDRVAQNWLFLRIMRLMGVEQERLIRNTVHFNDETLVIAKKAQLTNSAVSIVGLLILISALFVSLYQDARPGVSTVAFVYIFMRLIQALAGLASTLSALASVKPQYDVCAKFLQTVSGPEIRAAVSPMRAPLPDQKEEKALSAEPSSPHLPAPAVSLQSLSFAFESTRHRLFEKLSLEVPAGEVCALVGPSGSGKTTLLTVVAGQLAPVSGEVLVGGLPAADFFAGDLCRVGFVGTVPYLVAGTIRDNLCLGIPWEPSQASIESALLAAQITDVVTALPDGLNHRLLAGGDGLSSGEKQRLCLARALLGKPNILFLDEMSANLDQKTETVIAQSLAELKGRCTILLSTHRTTFLGLADKTITLPQQRALDNASVEP